MATRASGKRTFDALLNQAEFIHQEDGNWEIAIEIYKDLVMRDPESSTPPQQRRMWMGFSRCFYELGEYNKAIHAGTAAIEMNRFFPQVYKYVALAQKASGDHQAAKATLSKAILYEAPWDDENRNLNLALFQEMFGRDEKEMSVPVVDSVLLYGVDQVLWKICFGKDEEWPCELISLPETCRLEDLEAILQRPGLGCVVIDDCTGPHFKRLLRYYQQEKGLVVFFGIEGVFELSGLISGYFGVTWQFSAYTKYEYVLSDVGKQVFGDAIVQQQYTKSNLLFVPPQDRILVPKPYWGSAREYQEDEGDSDNENDNWEEKYADHVEELGRKVPFALHRAAHGGQVAYLGFVNGDGHIPAFVRALCTRSKTSL